MVDSKSSLELLKCKPSSTIEEIKKSYRSLAKIYHPDSGNKEASQEVFISITEAYNWLIENHNPTSKVENSTVKNKPRKGEISVETYYKTIGPKIFLPDEVLPYDTKIKLLDSKYGMVYGDLFLKKGTKLPVKMKNKSGYEISIEYKPNLYVAGL